MNHIIALSFVLNFFLIIHALGVYYEAQRLKRVYKTKQPARTHRASYVPTQLTKRSRITLN